MPFCSNCGKETIPGDLYCEGCGVRYDQYEKQSQDRDTDTTDYYPDEKTPGKKRGKSIRRVVFILLLIALATAAYYIKSNLQPRAPGSPAEKINPPAEQAEAAVNAGVQPDTKPAEDRKPVVTVEQPQTPVSTPAGIKKEKPLQPAKSQKPAGTTIDKKTAKAPGKGKSVVLFSTWNNNGLLLNNPVVERIKWNITKEVMITRVTTYHWNGGKGDPGGGTLTFNGSKDFGPFRVTRIEAGDDGTANAKWIFEPGIVLSPGKYKIEQTGKRTLSHNVASAGQGFIKVEGYYTGE